MTFTKWLEHIKYQITNVHTRKFEGGIEAHVFSFTSKNKKVGTDFYMDLNAQKALVVDLFDFGKRTAYAFLCANDVTMPDLAYYDANGPVFYEFINDKQVFEDLFAKIMSKANE